jgi:hypothetical protein
MSRLGLTCFFFKLFNAKWSKELFSDATKMQSYDNQQKKEGKKSIFLCHFIFIYFQNKYKNTFFLLSTERHTKKIGLHTDWKNHFQSLHISFQSIQGFLFSSFHTKMATK